LEAVDLPGVPLRLAGIQAIRPGTGQHQISSSISLVTTAPEVRQLGLAELYKHVKMKLLSLL